MAIHYHQLTTANSGLTGYAVAKELAKQTLAQFGAVRGSGAGIGDGSCCAAVAVVPANGFGAVRPLTGFGAGGGNYPPPVYGNQALPYSVAFGNSQLASGGLDLGPLGGHAERAALTAAGNNQLTLYLLNGQDAVLYVELTPCNGCQTWLGGNGGGVANPFDFQNGNISLHVWYSWVYPGDGSGIAAMKQFHNDTFPNQLATVNGW